MKLRDLLSTTKIGRALVGLYDRITDKKPQSESRQPTETTPLQQEGGAGGAARGGGSSGSQEAAQSARALHQSQQELKGLIAKNLTQAEEHKQQAIKLLGQGKKSEAKNSLKLSRQHRQEATRLQRMVRNVNTVANKTSRSTQRTTRATTRARAERTRKAASKQATRSSDILAQLDSASVPTAAPAAQQPQPEGQQPSRPRTKLFRKARAAPTATDSNMQRLKQDVHHLDKDSQSMLQAAEKGLAREGQRFDAEAAKFEATMKPFDDFLSSANSNDGISEEEIDEVIREATRSGPGGKP